MLSTMMGALTWLLAFSDNRKLIVAPTLKATTSSASKAAKTTPDLGCRTVHRIDGVLTVHLLRQTTLANEKSTAYQQE